MKVLVAGGAGFIGSHVCTRLLSEGHRVICADNLLTGSKNNISALLNHPEFVYMVQDIISPFDCEVDAIFHLASPASPVGYLGHPIETLLVNTQGTYNLLNLARAHKAMFLISSTSEAYGDPLQHPQQETYWGNVNPIGPRACYDESKRVAETFTMEYVRQYKLDARIVRIFNTYGPNSQVNDGRMIPNFVANALQNKPLTIYGDGTFTRSICYVDDLVEGLMRAMYMPHTTGEVINLGNPSEHTVLEYAQMIIDLCHSSSSVTFDSKRVDDPERRRPDITKARKLLQWSPSITPQDGLARTIEWFRSIYTPVLANSI